MKGNEAEEGKGRKCREFAKAGWQLLGGKHQGQEQHPAITFRMTDDVDFFFFFKGKNPAAPLSTLRMFGYLLWGKLKPAVILLSNIPELSSSEPVKSDSHQPHHGEQGGAKGWVGGGGYQFWSFPDKQIQRTRRNPPNQSGI